MISLQYSVLIGVVACIISLLYYLMLPDRGICPAGFEVPASFLSEESWSIQLQDHTYAECFFPLDYDDSVTTFKAMALKAGADVRSMEVRTSSEEVLHTWVAVLHGHPGKGIGASFTT